MHAVRHPRALEEGLPQGACVLCVCVCGWMFFLLFSSRRSVLIFFVRTMRCPLQQYCTVAVVAAQSWATLEDQEDIAEALAADAKDALTERMAGIVAEEIDPSDDEKELNESGDAESGGGRKVEAPPPYSDLSSCFGPLEQKAESAGNSEAAHFLRKAKMAFLAAHAAKPTRQADIRMFSES